MALGGGVKAVQRVGGAGDRRVESEGQHGAFEVVVDRLRHSDNGHAALEQLLGDAQGTVPADADQSEHIQFFQAGVDAVDQLLGEAARVAVADLAEKRPRLAVPRMVRGSAGRRVSGNRGREAVGVPGCRRSRRETAGFPAAFGGRLGHGPDDRVQAGAISAARDDADSIRHLRSPWV